MTRPTTNRSIDCGGSNINVSTWSRGHAAEWDPFADAADNVAWRHNAVLALYKSHIEAYTGTDTDGCRGRDGVVAVPSAPDAAPVARHFLAAAQQRGLPRFSDPNGAMKEADGARFLAHRKP